ncbi:MAG: hypothetical protein WAN14_20015 [Candidatus Acidiferrales bacterium]
MNLQLLRHERLEWLVTLGLMVLYGAAAEARHFSAARAWNELSAGFESLVHVAVFVWRGNDAILAQINCAHSCPVNVGIETARFEIIIGGLRRTRGIGLLKEHVKRQQRAGLAIIHAQALARLAPYHGGIIDIVRIGTRVGRPAKPARVEFVDARAALTSVARLAVHLPAESAAFFFRKFAASRIHAYPEAGKSAKEIMNTARK